MTVVKLSQLDGSPIWVNLDNLLTASADREREGTRLVLSGGVSITVKETVKDISTMPRTVT